MKPPSQLLQQSESESRPLEKETTEPATDVLAAYRRWAPIYDWVFGLSLGRGRDQAVQQLSANENDQILEIGVGTGLSLPHWPAKAALTGIDLSPDMLAKADQLRTRHKMPHVSLLSMDAQQMTFQDSQFDKIAAMYVVSVVPNPEALLNEIVRVGRHGARVVLINHFEAKQSWLRTIERMVTGISRVLGFNSALPIDFVMRIPGLKIVDVRPANWFGYWTLIVGEIEKPAPEDISS